MYPEGSREVQSCPYFLLFISACKMYDKESINQSLIIKSKLFLMEMFMFEKVKL